MPQDIPPGDPCIPFDETPVRVEISWTGEEPSHTEIIAMRQLVPEFAATPMADVKRMLTSKPSYTLGVFPRSSLWPREERIKELGLLYTLHEENC